MNLMAQNKANKRTETLLAFHELFDFAIENSHEDLLHELDFDFFCTQLCKLVMGLGDQGFLPKAKKLYDDNLIETFYIGNWEVYEGNFDLPRLREVFEDTRDWYRGPAHAWIKTEPEFEKKHLFKPPQKTSPTGSPQRLTPVKAEPKVGRNDPCPCGSGKKYKKCHGKA
jgi:hypothetical protein